MSILSRRIPFPSNRLRQAGSRAKFHGLIRRNRVLLVALIAVGALVALLSGIGAALYGDGDWTEQTPANNPPRARFGAASTFDQTIGATLIFGGFTGADPPASLSVAMNDTYSYSSRNNQWTNRNPVHSPDPRGYASMVYDGARRNVVMFGGAPYYSNNVFGETWIWDGVDWTLRNPPEPRPSARQNASMIYDAHRKVVVMFGGRNAQGTELRDTWTWDGTAWKELDPATKPLKRHSAAMAYDLCRAETVLFGGVGSSREDIEADETWTWDGTTWTERTPELPSPSPTGRLGAGMVYSPTTGSIVLYGGLMAHEAPQSHGSRFLATDENVWYWDGTGWEKVVQDYASMALERIFGGWAAGQPRPRAYAGFVFDSLVSPSSQSGPLRIFGGTPSADARTILTESANIGPFVSNSTAVQTAFSDLWAFEEKTGTTLQQRNCPNPVPLPLDDDVKIETSQRGRVETSDEFKEWGQLPVLLGTKPNPCDPNTSCAHPGQTSQPPCINAREAVEGTPAPEAVHHTHLAVDASRNRIYQFFMCQNHQIYGGGIQPGENVGANSKAVKIQAYDATTLRPVGKPALAPTPPSGGSSDIYLNQVSHATESGHFLLSNNESGTENHYVIQQDLIEKGGNPVVARIPLPAGRVSYFRHPRTGRGKLLVEASGELSQYDLEDLIIQYRDTPSSQVPSEKDWSLSGICSVSNQEMGMMRVGNLVYVSCPDGVMRITVAEAADGTESAGVAETFPGPAGVVTSAFPDPAAERMSLVANKLDRGRTTVTLWTFDGESSRWIGRVGIAGTNSLGATGFDPETGRLYALILDEQIDQGNWYLGGLAVIDTRLTPVPQALLFTQWMRPAQAQMSVLPAKEDLPRRLFMRRAAGTTPSTFPGEPEYDEQAIKTADQVSKAPDGEKVAYPDDMYWLVLQDDLPIPKQPAIGEKDILTIPMAPDPTKTDETFNGEGSGYGMRLRDVGGSKSRIDLGGYDTVPACYKPERELLAGWVSRVNLSDLTTSASSYGLEVDQASKVDLDAPVSRCGPNITPNNFSPDQRQVIQDLWPLVLLGQNTGNKAVSSGAIEIELPVDDDNGDPRKVGADAGTGTSWANHFNKVECAGHNPTSSFQNANVQASATCQQRDAWVKGEARAGTTGGEETDTAALSVAEGSSKVVATRDPEKGIVVTSTAIARGIRIGPISIDRVETKAVSWSNGRPFDEPRAIFVRQICGVQTPDYSVPNGCLNSSQQKQFVDGLNQFLTRQKCAGSCLNGKASLPTPDLALLNGSPGGYVAGVTKQLSANIEDQIFISETHQEVPGLQIEIIRDSAGYYRQILQLAGVRAFTGFGVQCQTHLVYSPSAKDCVPLPEDTLIEEDILEDEEYFFEEDQYPEEDQRFFTPVATGLPVSLGSKIGKLLDKLPVIRHLPIRDIGEAFLAGSVWWLLGLPLFLASRRLALSTAGAR